jgi:hypothetical protein
MYGLKPVPFNGKQPQVLRLATLAQDDKPFYIAQDDKS